MTPTKMDERTRESCIDTSDFKRESEEKEIPFHQVMIQVQLSGVSSQVAETFLNQELHTLQDKGTVKSLSIQFDIHILMKNGKMNLDAEY